jgi:hypothetical protein
MDPMEGILGAFRNAVCRAREVRRPATRTACVAVIVAAK